MMHPKDLVSEIENAPDERTLLSLAYRTQGQAKVGVIQPQDYVNAMVKLAERLGFGITDEALAKAAKKYITE